MDSILSRRQFGKALGLTAAAGTAFAQLERSAALATSTSDYKAMVGIFLFGGNDGWNMVVPTDARYATYASTRNSALVLGQSSLVTLAGVPYGLNGALAPLKSLWNEGALGLVLNAGTLYAPLTKAQYQGSPTLRPVNLMSHADEQKHWQGLRARASNTDGFMGRLTDRIAQTTIPATMSFNGATMAVLGKSSSSLILPSVGTATRSGYPGASVDPVLAARGNALTALADASTRGTIAATTGTSMSQAYRQIDTANAILAPSTSTVDSYFVDPATGGMLNSDIARQLLRVARMIAARSTLGHSRQTFFVGQGTYDTHANQRPQQEALYNDLGLAIAAFYNAMKGLGLSRDVTAFTMSDFGRVYAGNGQGGSDHAWGNNHLVIGGALRPRTVHGVYPSQVLGGADDIGNDGRFIPTIAQEEYIGAIAKWHGVQSADMPYVFPNWSTFSTNGRGPIPLFS